MTLTTNLIIINKLEKQNAALLDALKDAYAEMEDIDNNHQPGLIDIQVLLKAKQAIAKVESE